MRKRSKRCAPQCPTILHFAPQRQVNTPPKSRQVVHLFTVHRSRNAGRRNRLSDHSVHRPSRAPRNKRSIAGLQRRRSAPRYRWLPCRLNLQEDGRTVSSVAACTAAPGCPAPHRTGRETRRGRLISTVPHFPPPSRPGVARAARFAQSRSLRRATKTGSGPACQRVPLASPPQSAVTKSPARRFCRTAKRKPRSAVARPRSALGNPRSGIVTLRSAP